MPLKDVVDKIKEHVDIVEVIGSRVSLKKVGKNYKGLCPFHDDRNPSFYVNPELGVYHCFGCGASGDVIKFVQEYEKMSFIDALKYLGDMVGISVKLTGDAQDRFYQVNEEAAKIYHSLLPQSQTALGYLKERGITEETIEEFQLGYAPNSDVILSRLGAKFGIDVLLKVGLVIRGQGRMYDRFRNRLMFPIYSPAGRVAGFGGRILGEGMPKYMNSPESPVYSKRNSLYSVFHSRKEILESKSVILVEGYFDYLSMYQAGFKNVLASLGTSLTEQQTRLISRYAQKVYLFYDMDEAGRRASLRSMGLLIDRDVEIMLCSSTGGKDPDEILRKEGNEGIKSILSSSKGFIDVLLEDYSQKYDLKNPSDLTKVVNDFREILSRIRDGVKQEIYREKISRELMIKEELLMVRKKGGVERKEVVKLSPDVKLELALMASMLLNGYRDEDLSILDGFNFKLDVVSEFIKKAREERVDREEIVPNLPQPYRDEVYKMLINGVDPVGDVMRRLKLQRIQEKLEETARKIKEHEKRGEVVTTLLKIQDDLLREKLKILREG